MDMSRRDVLNGKLTSSQEIACKEGNIRGVFGYPTKTEELAKKYRISPHKIDNLICQYGSMENYIKKYREGRHKEKSTNLNLLIDASSEIQKKEKSFLLEKIYGYAHYKEGLLLVDGEKVLAQLNTIPERYAEVLRYRIGLIDGRIYTLDELGEMFEITQERIRQIENKAIRILRKHIDSIVLYSEVNTEEQNFTPEGAARRKLLLDRIYNSNLIWIPDKEYEQEPDSIQRSELRGIVAELTSIQPMIEGKEHRVQSKISENETPGETSINILGLSTRTYMILKSAEITTIEQLSVTSTDELMAIRLAGTKSIEEIDAKLKELGIERTSLQSTTTVDTPISFDRENSIDILNLSGRAYNILNRAGITTIGQLRGTTTEELMTFRGSGRKSAEEIISKLEKLGVEGSSKESITIADTPNRESTELEKARAQRDELVRKKETLKQQTESAKQLLASYDVLIDGDLQKDETTPDLDGE